MEKIQLVVFDMAGTTVDEQNVVYRTVHRAIEAAGHSVSWETVLEQAAGKEKRQAISDVLAHSLETSPGEAEIDVIFENFKMMLDEAYASGVAKPMPGAETVFQELRSRGIRVVLNTGYSRAVAELLLQQLGWTIPETIDLLVTASDVERGRPHPDMVLAAMNALGITDGTTVAKIGDSTIDIEEGRSAGCSIYAGITTGAQTESMLASASPTHIFHSLSDLLSVL